MSRCPWAHVRFADGGGGKMKPGAPMAVPALVDDSPSLGFLSWSAGRLMLTFWPSLSEKSCRGPGGMCGDGRSSSLSSAGRVAAFWRLPWSVAPWRALSTHRVQSCSATVKSKLSLRSKTAWSARDKFGRLTYSKANVRLPLRGFVRAVGLDAEHKVPRRVQHGLHGRPGHVVWACGKQVACQSQ